MKKIRLVLLVLLVVGGLFFFDPPIQRQISFGHFKATYEWRIFNNFQCNLRTSGHCYENDTNKINAEIELCRQLLDNYNGQEKMAAGLKSRVMSTPLLMHRYNELTKTNHLEFDSLQKYQDEIFNTIMLK